MNKREATLRWSGNRQAAEECDSAFRKLKPKIKAAAKPKKKRRRKPKKKWSYLAYIKSPEWKAKRQEALDHYGRKCSVCGTMHHLQVHHKSYARFGNERMSDLQILCDWCHNIEHEGKYESRDPLSERFRRTIQSWS